MQVAGDEDNRFVSRLALTLPATFGSRCSPAASTSPSPICSFASNADPAADLDVPRRQRTSLAEAADVVTLTLTHAGATPPAVYQLKPREKEFHGVQALRMIPAEGSDTSGRSGLLTHSFMLGPKGDSNGCVSIRDYDRFLKAFNDGEINRLVVVPSLRGGTLALQRSTSQS